MSKNYYSANDTYKIPKWQNHPYINEQVFVVMCSDVHELDHESGSRDVAALTQEVGLACVATAPLTLLAAQVGFTLLVQQHAGLVCPPALLQQAPLFLCKAGVPRLLQSPPSGNLLPTLGSEFLQQPVQEKTA